MRLLPRLREAQVGPYRFLQEIPALRATAIPIQPAELRQVRWEGTTARATGVVPRIAFRLPSPRNVAGIRIRYAHANRQGGPARFELRWRHPGQREYPPSQHYTYWYLPTGEGKQTTVWVDDLVSDFRIQPDNQPCEFRIDAIELLTAPGEASDTGRNVEIRP
jgi:hypothetical protein